MMNLQYIADKSGHTIAVQIQIPIEEWNVFKSKYREFDEDTEQPSMTIPEWQIRLGKEELRNIAENNTELIDWNEAKNQFKV